MATRNDVTGDELKSRGNTEAYQSGYDRIWGNKKKQQNEPSDNGQTNKESQDVQPPPTR